MATNNLELKAQKLEQIAGQLETMSVYNVNTAEVYLNKAAEQLRLAAKALRKEIV